MNTPDLEQRLALLGTLQQHLHNVPGTQALKAKALGITQPRLSDLLRNRADKFSLDALVALTKKAGLQLNVNAQSVPFQRPSVGSIQPRRAGSPFPVDPRQLGQLDASAASHLLLRILRCEVLAAGLSPKNVTLSIDITTADGGIDAKVEGYPSRDGLLGAGDTHFQIKTGTAFKPWQPAQIRKELLGSNVSRPSKKVLGDAVRECLNRDGMYCLVVFGYDLLPKQHTAAQQHLTDLFRACGYPSPRVMVLSQGHLAGEIEEFPSIYCELLGFEHDNFQALREWSRSPQMTLPLSVGKEQSDAITSIREALMRDAPTHIRLIGEPGIGKTRLALEALSIEDLAPSVVYVPTGEDFQKSRLFRNILRVTHPFFLILVIDDCDDSDRSSILSALQNNRSVRLVTVDHGYDRGKDSAVTVVECPRLGEESILAILRLYIESPDYDLRKWAELCEGSPRVAHAVGENLKNNPNDVLRPPASVPLWERYISGFAKTDSIAAREHKLVLRYIALFTRFGFEHPVSEEGRFIAELVNEADPSVTWPRFQAIVKHFQDRRILQGRHTLFLVPKALHIYLWVDFWNQHGRGFDFEVFLKRMPSTMRDWFLRLFTYAHEAEPALAVVKQLLSPQGPLSRNDAIASTVTPRLVRYLAEADPQSTLSYIERTYGSWSHGDLLAWKDGRQDIVWALEFIAVWADCFERAARVLATMAVAENENNSNNSRGTLVDLFSVGLGWASTQATPAQRFPTLERLVTSRDDAPHALGLELAKSWLSTHGGSRIVGPEHQGLRPKIDFWRPETYGVVFDAWRKVWTLLEQEFYGASAQRRDAIAGILISSALGLISFAALSEQIVATLFKLAGTAALDKKPLIGLTIDLLMNRNSQLPEDVIVRIRELDEMLTGTSLWDRISRYVLHSNWNEDYDLSEGSARPSKIPSERVDALAAELMNSKKVFGEHAGRLLRVSGHRLSHLGASCGTLAGGGTWDDLLRREMTESGDGLGAEFLAGYLAGVRQHDKSRWEGFLLTLLESDQFRKVGVECAWRSGVSDRVLGRMVELFVAGTIEASAFSRFVLRSGSENISEKSLNEVVDALLDCSDAGASAVTLELLYDFYLTNGEGSSKRAIPRDRPLKALVASTSALGGREPMREFYWGRLAKEFSVAFPEDSFALLEAAFTSDNLSRFMHSEVSKVLTDILKSKPLESWQVISGLLEGDAIVSFRVATWLNGEVFEERKTEPSAAGYLPVADIIKWVKENPEKRAARALQFLPQTLDPTLGGRLTERFIEEFSDDRDIAGGIAAHFWTGGWSGPRSGYLERKRDSARQWLSSATSPVVQSWLSEFISSLSEDIESAKIGEERGF